MFSARRTKGHEIKILHKLVQIFSTNRKKHLQKRCRICTTKHYVNYCPTCPTIVRKATRLICSSCEDFPGLCSRLFPDFEVILINIINL